MRLSYAILSGHCGIMVVVGGSMGVWSDQQGMLVGSRRKLMRGFGLQHPESQASEGSR